MSTGSLLLAIQVTNSRPGVEGSFVLSVTTALKVELTPCNDPESGTIVRKQHDFVLKTMICILKVMNSITKVRTQHRQISRWR